MKRNFALLALIAGTALTVLAPTAAHAQKAKARKPIVTQASQSRGTGTDENIKNADVTNTKGHPAAAPARKGGAKSRGMVGELHIDNRTGYYVNIYVDGNALGTIEPYGDYFGSGDCESFTLYAVAHFSDGTSQTWGPVTTNASCGDQTWTLR